MSGHSFARLLTLEAVLLSRYGRSGDTGRSCHRAIAALMTPSLALDCIYRNSWNHYSSSSSYKTDNDQMQSTRLCGTDCADSRHLPFVDFDSSDEPNSLVESVPVHRCQQSESDHLCSNHALSAVILPQTHLMRQWFVILSLTLLLTAVLAITSRTKASTMTRKLFHLCISLVFVTGLKIDVSLLAFCSASLLAVFIVLEVSREKCDQHSIQLLNIL